MHKSFLLSVMALCVCSRPSVRMPPSPVHPLIRHPKIEIPVGFSFVNVHPNLAPITSVNVFGGGRQFDVNFGNYFGIKADFMEYTQSTGLKNQLGSKLDY
jgi:hypothetical protein